MVRSFKTSEPCARWLIGPQAVAASGTRSRATKNPQTISTTQNATPTGGGSQVALLELVRCLRASAERARDTGVRDVPKAGRPVAPRGRTVPAPSDAAPPIAAAIPAAGAAETGLAAVATLPALREHMGDCRRCQLAGGRTHLVFGVGNAAATLMFVGEGPGRDEDLQGEPFVGRAGQLLTEIITKGMKLNRADVYIANVVKCRPPENRNPEPEEIASCLPFLARQVELVRPQVIVALGKFAAQTLLAVNTPITRMRGVWHEYRGVKVMPTFHPAYLLRNPGDKKLVWEDIKKVMLELGLPV